MFACDVTPLTLEPTSVQEIKPLNLSAHEERSMLAGGAGYRTFIANLESRLSPRRTMTQADLKKWFEDIKEKLKSAGFTKLTRCGNAVLKNQRTSRSEDFLNAIYVGYCLLQSPFFDVHFRYVHLSSRLLNKVLNRVRNLWGKNAPRSRKVEHFSDEEEEPEEEALSISAVLSNDAAASARKSYAVNKRAFLLRKLQAPPKSVYVSNCRKANILVDLHKEGFVAGEVEPVVVVTPDSLDMEVVSEVSSNSFLERKLRELSDTVKKQGEQLALALNKIATMKRHLEAKEQRKKAKKKAKKAKKAKLVKKIRNNVNNLVS